MRKDMLEINANVLMAEFERRGISRRLAGRAIGYSVGYMNQVYKSNKISRPAAMLIQQTFKIPLSAYAIPEENDGGAAEEKPQTDYNKLLKCIHVAVYGAVSKAIEENNERLCDGIYEVMKKALAGD